MHEGAVMTQISHLLPAQVLGSPQVGAPESGCSRRVSTTFQPLSAHVLGAPPAPGPNELLLCLVRKSNWFRLGGQSDCAEKVHTVQAKEGWTVGREEV